MERLPGNGFTEVSMTIVKWLARSAVVVAIAASVGYGAANRGTPVTTASNGEIIIGTTATNGDIQVGGVTANSGPVILAATNGQIHIGG
jgi:hypothetical protein